jgi:hypothetical protein
MRRGGEGIDFDGSDDLEILSLKSQGQPAAAGKQVNGSGRLT